MEHAEGSIRIEALVDVMEVLEDYEAYPSGPRSGRPRCDSGEGGRATEVPRSTSRSWGRRATLSYRYAPGDTGLSWITKEARGAIRDIRGEYPLNEVSGSVTDVTYRLAVEIGVLVPGSSGPRRRRGSRTRSSGSSAAWRWSNVKSGRREGRGRLP